MRTTSSKKFLQSVQLPGLGSNRSTEQNEDIASHNPTAIVKESPEEVSRSYRCFNVSQEKGTGSNVYQEMCREASKRYVMRYVMISRDML